MEDRNKRYRQIVRQTQTDRKPERKTNRKQTERKTNRQKKDRHILYEASGKAVTVVRQTENRQTNTQTNRCTYNTDRLGIQTTD
jgi:hypothetical protein